MKHTYYVCDGSCAESTGHCFYCDGGLASCTTCGGAEGSLLPTCPGYKLTADAQDAVCDRKIKTVDDLRPEHRAC